MHLSKQVKVPGGWYKRGKMKNYHCFIVFDWWSDDFYFKIEGPDKQFEYEDNRRYRKEDDCRIACERYIENAVRKSKEELRYAKMRATRQRWAQPKKQKEILSNDK